MNTTNVGAESGPRPALLKRSLLKHSAVRQFLKFCIVGASSTTINFLIFNLLLTFVFSRERYGDVAANLSAVPAFLVSVVNGYFWNRRWTFASAAPRALRRQFTQFLAVNLVGLALNQSIVFVGSRLLHHYADLPFKPAANLSLLGATGLVVFWNFLANKHWTFRPH